ncbi:MAG: hypothetical protein GXP54_05510, partial [Deltaproteobacteria bacterium]|nr:hypothetical protein [Deltaproteobacteria bacterium]
MEGDPTVFRVFASRRFFFVALAGLVLTAAAALNVQQGLTDHETLATYPLSMGPYIVLFGLNHLGASLFVWFWVLLMLLHAIAAFMKGERPSGDPVPSRAVSTPLAVLAVAALAGLLMTGLAKTPPRITDTTRLAVAVSDSPAGALHQIVEEGASYQVPGKDGERTLTFGAVSHGPYALERTAGGALRAHLPIKGSGSVIGVRSRRPMALSQADHTWLALPAGLDRSLGLLAPFIALAVLITAMRRWSGSRDHKWPAAVLLACCVLLAANPFSGPGSS